MSDKTQITLADALLRRKELAVKVQALTVIKATALFETKAVRKNVTENLDDVIAQVPKLNASQVTAELDWHSRQLRLLDSSIQRANWNTVIEIDSSVMTDYVQPEPKK